MGGDRKRGRTQRRHFNQGRENVWKHDSKKTRPEESAAVAAPDGANPSWQPFSTRNTGFEEYYKMQEIVREEEWEDFVSCLQKPLPAAFRINSSGQFFKDIMFQLENDFVESLKAEVNDENEVEAIRPLPWYPGKLAWHMNFSRMQLRKSKTLERFHEFLKQENEVGNITRQEAVSMVPPLFLNVLPDHCILDMCAAPGSKTFQLLEIIHQSTKSGSLPNGLVIANDVDVQRCNLLIHQTKRMCSANLIVTNHEGQHFPSCFSKDYDSEALKQEDEVIKKSLQFDRILCDVPCSGDGTLRKAPDIWRKWNAGMGNGLHRLQVEIAMRGIALLKVGGRMVYSTCSMNPVENEAVVAEILRRTGGSVELLDVSNELPELIRRPGLRTWKIKDRGVWLESYKDVNRSRRSVVLPSMFPSGLNHENFAENNGQEHHNSENNDQESQNSENNGKEFQNSENNSSLIDGKTENNLKDDSGKNVPVADADLQTKKEISSFPLEYCMRILPHDQNTGAFFIAVFQKLSSLNAITEIPVKQATKSHQHSAAKSNQKMGIVCEAETGSLKNIVDEGGATPSDADLIVEQPTNDVGTVADIESKDSESVEASGNSEINKENIKEIKQKSQTQGKWRGVDPVVFFSDEATINSIRSFYGISDSFLLDGHLVTRNPDVEHVKRIYYISKSVHDILNLNFQVGERLKITSVGLKVFERQSSKDGSPCSFRLSSEGLPLLLPYISKQILYATLTDFKHLLQYRTIKFADFVDSNFRIKSSTLIMGCCIVVLNGENVAEDDIVVDSSTIAIVCWRGRTNLSIMLSEFDARELLERLATSFGIQIDSKPVDTEDTKMEDVINVTANLDTEPLDASEK